MNKILIFVFVLAIIFFSGCAAQKPPSVRVETLSDFENSDFCKLYDCLKEDSWALNSGGINNDYKNNLNPDVSVEVQSSGQEVIGLGLMFYDRTQLSNNDLRVIYNLLKSIDTKEDLTNITFYINTNIETRVFQIKEAKASSFSTFKVYVGKVGPQQIIHLEKIKK